MVIALSAVYTLPYGVGRGNGAEWKADKAQHPLSGVFLVYKLCEVHLRVTESDVHLTVNASLGYGL